jgi:hypothetical protein
MRAQNSTPIPSTPTAIPKAISHTTFTGLAAILDKVRRLQLGSPLRPWHDCSPEEQEQLLFDARAAINAQDPSKSRRAQDLALERAERVIEEEGALSTPQARSLARRIAAEAILTNRLALQGNFDEAKTAGGVQ